MTPEELEEQIPWEAEHHIPFSKDDVEIDHQLVGSEGGSGGQMELLLVAAKKEVVSDYSMVIREAKLVPMIMDVAAFTIQNAYEATIRWFLRRQWPSSTSAPLSATSTSWRAVPAHSRAT